MALDINIENGIVILEYFPEMIGPDAYMDLLEKKGSRVIYNTFLISSKDAINIDGDYIQFKIGIVEGYYNRIFSNILRTKHEYCFDKEISLYKNDFVAVRKTSILGLLDQLITTNEHSIYIEKKTYEVEEENHILYSDFVKFKKSIPHNAELDKYIKMRAATVFKGLFKGADITIEKHNNWIAYIENKINYGKTSESEDAEFEYLHKVDYIKLLAVREKLDYYITNCDSYNESTFQRVISEIICFIFPKYLYAIREVRFKGFDEHDKQPDFVMVDYNGMIDFLEIKKPSVKLINKRTYRNNYSPSNELSGSAQQIEKYISCVQRCAGEWETKPPKKIAYHIPPDFSIKILNPQGIIVMGNASEFKISEKKDFELIKRQYKHITEIITYDDLILRLDNMIAALEQYKNTRGADKNS